MRRTSFIIASCISLLFSGCGNKPTLTEGSFESLKRTAEQGDARAQYELGEMYDKGEDVAANSTEAVKWYRKAAEQGHPGAQWQLGYKYEYGSGVAVDNVESLKWFRRAAEQDHGIAQFELAMRYHTGKGTAKDLVEAYKWVLLAQTNGIDVTAYKDLLEKEMTPEQMTRGPKQAEAYAAEMEKNEKEKTPVKLSKGKFTVCVQVECEDESLKYKLLTLRKKELRKIADVRVVDRDEQPDYIISLAAVINKAGEKEVGYSYSYAFLKPHCADGQPETGDRTNYLGGGIQAVPQGSIKSYCQSEVASFNQTVLAPLRNKE